MAKKRSLPHAHMAKAKKAMPRTFTPALNVSDETAAESPMPQRTPAASLPSSVLRPTPRSARSGNVGLTTDYRYIISDLKRIGILSAAMLVVLVALTFVIK